MENPAFAMHSVKSKINKAMVKIIFG